MFNDDARGELLKDILGNILGKQDSISFNRKITLTREENGQIVVNYDSYFHTQL